MLLMHQWSLRLKVVPGLQPALVSLVGGLGSYRTSIRTTVREVGRLSASIIKTRRLSFCIPRRWIRGLRRG